ncbi:uncharacterized protein N0V96_011393 [Colletotrichum fioriniae]|uniref:uncharacterized protein n=1 Tax=Colletotrichum fioriniae TaxID=710243 RepID=UPI0032DB4421|nr:hypothetical protein N0V96_011393 [Colletotrichum fioriniae]
MKSSIVLAATGAVLAMGAAIDPRAMETVFDVTYVTVTVTEGVPVETPAATPSSSLPPKVEETPAPAPPVVEQPVASEPAASSSAAPVTSVVETTQSTPSTAATVSDLQTAAIDAHNNHRSNHSAPALTWDADLASYALITAKTCVFEHDMTTGGGGYGQNLAMWGATGSENLGEAKAAQRAITEQWYNGELNLYPGYGQASPDMTNFLQWGHFSQLVWVDTTKVGCGVYYCAAGTLSSIGSWYTVCNYKSQGNVIGSFDKNVLPPGNAATITVA